MQLPHISVGDKLYFLTDPIARRVLAFDISGKQRGVYTLPSGNSHPLGIQAVDDNTVFVADIDGKVHKLAITIPPETQTELDALGTPPAPATSDAAPTTTP